MTTLGRSSWHTYILGDTKYDIDAADFGEIAAEVVVAEIVKEALSRRKRQTIGGRIDFCMNINLRRMDYCECRSGFYFST
jgi:hypothetical protein